MNRSDGSTADYYVLPEGATQLQDLISHRNMNAQIGEIIRACYRYGMASHSDMLRDAKKIRFYAQAEVERLEKLEAASEQCGQLAKVEEEKPLNAVSLIPPIEIPQWVDAPQWANYLAQDESGDWFWYEHPIEVLGRYWAECDGFDGRVEFVSCRGRMSDWKKTVQHRPQ